MDEWEINDKGEIKRIENKNHDAFYMTDKDGNRIEGKSISFKYGTIQHNEGTVQGKGGEYVKYDAFQVLGDDNGTQVFEFMANNTGVTKEHGGSVDKPIEWSHNQVGVYEGIIGMNIVSTIHEELYETSGNKIVQDRINSGEVLRKSNHNHPYRDSRDFNLAPSGLPNTSKAGLGDIGAARFMEQVNYPNQPIFNVYSGYFKRYVQYNSQGFIKKK